MLTGQRVEFIGYMDEPFVQRIKKWTAPIEDSDAFEKTLVPFLLLGHSGDFKIILIVATGLTI